MIFKKNSRGLLVLGVVVLLAACPLEGPSKDQSKPKGQAVETPEDDKTTLPSVAPPGDSGGGSEVSGKGFSLFLTLLIPKTPPQKEWSVAQWEQLEYYQWGPEEIFLDLENPRGIDLLAAAVKRDPKIQVNIQTDSIGVSVAGIAYDLDGDGETPKWGFDPDHPLWVDPDDPGAWGWMTNGFWGYYTQDPGQEDYVFSNIGASSRVLKNGSADKWHFVSLGVFFGS